MKLSAAEQASLTLKQPLLITDGLTNRQLSIILKQAADDAAKRIEQNLAKGTFSGQIRAAQLEAVIAGVGPISTELWSEVGKITRSGMYSAAQLAADQSLDLDLLQGMPAVGIIQTVDAMYFSASQVVEDLISRHTSGVQLADRIYANGKATVQQVGRIVDKALVQQLSAKELAAQVKGFYRPDVPGGASYAASRLARTEINNAHHETTKRLAQERPWMLGLKWNLSGSHPRPDECNDYAEQDTDNLGPGVFKPENAPSKPHPQCLCYLSHVQEDPKVFQQKLAQGDYDSYLSKYGAEC